MLLHSWLRQFLFQGFRRQKSATQRLNRDATLRVTKLERRRVLNATALMPVDPSLVHDDAGEVTAESSNVVIDIGDDGQDSASDILHVFRDGAETHVTLNDVLVYSGLTTDLDSLTLSADDGVAQSLELRLGLDAHDVALHIEAGAEDSLTISGQVDVAEFHAAAGEITVDAAIDTDGGAILLDGDRHVALSGSLDASSDDIGGTVLVMGESVHLSSAAVIDASGSNGGGEILVGGGFHGADGRIENSFETQIDAGAQLHTDALEVGNGGSIVVWADGATHFAGSISAQGGTVSGDGGQVEVSGLQTLDFDGAVDTSAPHGATGSLLLDPATITVLNGGAASNFAGTVAAAAVGPSTLTEADLEGLAATTNLSLQATNGLTISDLTDNLLTLKSTGAVTFNAGSGNFVMSASDTLQTAGASVSITGSSIALGTLEALIPPPAATPSAQPAQGVTLNSATGATTLLAGSTFAVDIQGNAGEGKLNGHDQLLVNGSVTLNSKLLVRTDTLVADEFSAGKSFVILANDGSDPISGTFAGLSDGAQVTDASFTTRTGLTGFVTYFGDDGNDVAIVIDRAGIPVTVEGTSGNDAITVRVVGNTVQTILTDTNAIETVVDARPLTAVQSLVINAGDGNDTFTLDLPTGFGSGPMPLITFNGGAGNDALTVQGSSLDELTYQATGSGSGEITLNDGLQIGRVQFGNLEQTSIQNSIEDVTIDIDNGPTDGFAGPLTTTLSTNLGLLTVDFNGGATDLTLNSVQTTLSVLGDEFDADTFNVNLSALSSSFTAELIIDGQRGSDTINVSSNLTAAGLTLTAESIRLGGNLTTEAAISGGLGDITLTGAVTLISAVTIDTDGGIADGDLTVNGPLSGAFDLALATGTGTATFNGPVSNLGDGTDAAITVAAGTTGQTRFVGAVAANSGLSAAAGSSLRFHENLTLGSGNTATNLAGNVQFDGMNVMSFNDLTLTAVTLSGGSVTLDSNGSNILIGTLTGAQNLNLGSGIGAGTTTFTGAVNNLGDGQDSAINVESGVTGLVHFQNTVAANSGLTSHSGTTVRFSENVTLASGSTTTNLAGNVQLDGLTFSGFDELAFGATTLQGGPVTVNSNGGSIEFVTLTGAQDLSLAAGISAGTTTFKGAVTNLGDGIGPALTVQNGVTGLVEFQSTLTANSGLNGAAGTTVRFNEDVTLADGDSGTTLSNATLAGLTLSSFDGVNITAATLSNGAVTLNSNGSNIQLGTLTGAQDLVIAAGTGTGTTTVAGAITNLGDGDGAALTVESGVTGLVLFQNTVAANSGLSAAAGSSVRFDQDVTLGNGNTGTNLAGNVQLDGLNVSGFDSLNFAAVTLSGGPVALNSNGGAIQLGTLTGPQDLSIAAGTGVGTTTVSGAVTNLGDGSGSAFTVANGVTGLVHFESTVAANSGLTSAAGTAVRFDDDVTLGNGTTGTNLGGSVQLDGLNVSGFDGLTFGATTLSSGAVQLNSNGGNIVIASLTGPYDLTLAAGIAAGTTTITGNVTNLGDGTGAALTVETGVTGLVRVQGSLEANSGIVAQAGTSVRFDNDVTLANGDTGTTLVTVQLDGLTFNSFDGLTMGATTLSGGSVALNSNGANIAIASVTGAQDFLVAAGTGAGTTTITGNITNLGDGTGAAITVANGVAGLVHFQGTVGANSGISAAAGTRLRFDQNVTLGNGNTGTTLDLVQLDGLTFSGFDGLTFVTAVLSGGAVTLNSNGSNIQIGRLSGTQNLTLAAGIGAGTTTITGAATNVGTGTGAAVTVANGVTGQVRFQDVLVANSGLTSSAGSSVRFDRDVTLANGDTGTNLAGNVQLDGISFSGFDGLSFGATTLSGAASELNSNGGNITIASLTGAQDFLVSSGTGNGTTTVTGNVTNLGDGAGAAFEIATGVTGQVRFQGTVAGNSGFIGSSSSNVRFDDNVTLANGTTATSLTGNVQLDGLTFSSFDGITFGATTLTGGPVTLNSNGGNIALSALTGAQDLTLATGIGAGTTTVTGNVTNLGDGTGAALTVQAGVTGLVRIQGTFAANSGLISAAGTSVRFDQDVTLGNGNTGTTLTGNTQLDGLTFSGFDGLTFGNVTLSTSAVTLNSNGSNLSIANVTGAQDLIFAAGIGAGTTTVNGAVSGVGDGVGAALTLNASGATDFKGLVALNSGITQANTAGTVTFEDNVTLIGGDTATTFNGNVVLDGLTFTTSGNNASVTFGNAGTDTLTTSTAAVIVDTSTSNKALTVNSATTLGADLTLSAGTTNLTLSGTVNGTNALTLNSTGITDINAAIGATTEVASITTNAGGTTTLGANVRARAMTFNDPVTLDTAAITLTDTTAAGDVLFAQTVDGNRDLTLAIAGSTTFAKNVGATTAIGDGTGAAIIINSTGTTEFQGTVTTASGITQANTAGTVTFRENVLIGAGNTGSAFAGAVVLDGLNVTATGSNATLSFAGTSLTGPTVALTGTEINFTGGANSVTGTAALRLQTPDATTSIEIGGASNAAPAVLNITTTDIAALADGLSSITLQSATTASTVAVAATSTFNDALTINGSTITFAATANLQTRSAAIALLGSVDPDLATKLDTTIGGGAGAAVQIGELTPAGTPTTQKLTIEINGDNGPGDSKGHDQLSVNGTVKLGGTLNLVASLTPGEAKDGTTFVIIANDGADLITTRFKDPADTTKFLAEGTLLNNDFGGSGKNAYITYTGGDGNDVAIVIGTAPAQTTLTITGTSTNDAITLSLSGDQLTVDVDGTKTTRALNTLSGLIINGDDGDDSITIDTTADVLPLGFLVINGDGGTDSVTISDSLAIGLETGGDLLVDAETITLNAASLRTTGGDISLTGAVTVGSNVTLSTNDGAAASANITITGTLNGAASGAQTLTLLTNSSGDISITGDVGATTPLNSLIVSQTDDLTFGGKLAVTNDLSLTANEIDFNGGTNSVSGTGTLIVQSFDAATSIVIGDTVDVVAQFDLTDSDIDALATGFSGIVIQGASTPAFITVESASFDDSVSLTGSVIVVNDVLQTTGATDSITLNGPAMTTTLSANIVTAGAPITLNDSVDPDPSITLDTTAGGTVPAGALVQIGTTAAQNLMLEILGNAGAGLANGHDQLTVNGQLALGGTLVLDTTSLTAAEVTSGAEFVLINNDLTDAISGSFAGLSEGTIVSADFGGSGLSATITYQGGDGNDVAIVVGAATAPTGLVIGTAGDDVIEVRQNGGLIETLLNSVIVDSRPIADAQTLVIRGGDGNDSIVFGPIGFSDIALAGGLTVDGESGSDTVTFNATLPLSSFTTSGDLTVTAETISVSVQTLATDGGTNAGNITLNGAVTLGANTTFDTNHAAGTDGNVTLGSAGSLDGGFALTLDAGTGDITLAAAVGSTTPLQSVTVTTADQVSLSNVTTRDGGLAVTTPGAGGISLNGNIATDGAGSTNAGAITFNGPVTLGADVRFDTNHATGADGNVLFVTPQSSLNSSSSPLFNSSFGLTVDAGTADVAFEGAIGNSPLGVISGLTITAADEVSFGAVTTRDGGLSVTAATGITLNQNISTIGGTNAGDIALTGPVTLAANVRLTTDHLTGADGDVLFNGASSTVNGGFLAVVTAGSGDVSFGGTIGGTSPLIGLSINSADDVRLPIVTTRDSGLIVVTNGTDPSITLTGNIATDGTGSTNAGLIGLTGPVTLGTDITVDTDHATGNDGNVLLSSTSSTLDGAAALTINAGQADVSLDGAVGRSVALTALTINTADDVSLADVTTTDGGLTVTTAGADPSISLGGNLSTVGVGSTNAGLITLSGPITLTQDVTVTTNHLTGTATDLSVPGTIDGGFNLTLNVGAADVALNGAVGSTTPLLGLRVTSADDVTLSTVTTRDNGLSISTAGADRSITLTGDVSTNGTGSTNAGDITLAGPVSLTAATTLNTDHAAGTDGNLLVQETLAGAGFDLTLATGTGTATFQAAVTNLGDGSGAALTIAANSTGLVRFESTLSANSGLSAPANSNVRFDDNVTLAAGDTPTTFNGNVTLDGLTFVANHAVTFGDDSGDALTISDVTTVATDAANSALTLNATTSLNGDLTLSSGTATISLNGEINGGRNLSLNSTGTTDINAALGATTELASLTTDASGTTQLGANVRAGAMTFNDDVVLDTQSITLTDTSAAGDLRFLGTLNGAQDLTLSIAGQTLFAAAVGATPIGDGTGSALTINSTGITEFQSTLATASGITQSNSANTITFRDSVSVAAGDTTLNGNVILDGLTFSTPSASNLTFGNALTDTLLIAAGTTISPVANLTINSATRLQTDLTLAATNTLTLNGSIDGKQNLVLNSAGTTALNGPVGVDTELQSLTTDATGTTQLANVIAASSMQFNDAVTLTAATTIRDASVAGDVLFNGTVSGANDLVIDVAGATIFASAVNIGDGTGAALTIDSSGTTEFQITLATSSGIAQDHSAGVITFRGNLTVSGGNTATNFDADVILDGLDLASSSDLIFGNSTSDSLTVTGSSKIAAAATTLNATTALNADFVLNTNAATMTVNAPINGNNDLTFNSTGATNINAPIGDRTPVSSLTTDASGTTTLAANITTQGTGISFGDDVVLAANVTLTNTNSAPITAVGPINADVATNNRTLTVVTPGTATFNGNIGNAQPLADLDVTGSGISIGATAITVTAQGNNTATFDGPVTLTSDFAVITDGVVDNNVEFKGTVTGLANTLSIATGSSDATFEDRVAVNSLFVGSGNDVRLAEVATGSGGINVTVAAAGIDAASITLAGNLSTDNSTTAGTISLNGPVILATNVSIDTDSTTADGNLTTVSTLDGSHQLTINAGTGDVSLQGAVGSTTPLIGLTINTADDVSLPTITTRDGGLSVTTAGVDPGITLNGNITTTGNGSTNAGAVSLTGPVTLASNVLIHTDHIGGSDGDVSFNGLTSTINGPFALTIDAGGFDATQVDSGRADITFGGDIGNATPLSGLTIVEADEVSIRNVTISGGNFLIGDVAEVAAASLPQVSTGTTKLPDLLQTSRTVLGLVNSLTIEGTAPVWTVTPSAAATATTVRDSGRIEVHVQSDLTLPAEMQISASTNTTLLAQDKVVRLDVGARYPNVPLDSANGATLVVGDNVEITARTGILTPTSPLSSTGTAALTIFSSPMNVVDIDIRGTRSGSTDEFGKLDATSIASLNQRRQESLPNDGLVLGNDTLITTFFTGVSGSVIESSASQLLLVPVDIQPDSQDAFFNNPNAGTVIQVGDDAGRLTLEFVLGVPGEKNLIVDIDWDDPSFLLLDGTRNTVPEDTQFAQSIGNTDEVAPSTYFNRFRRDATPVALTAPQSANEADETTERTDGLVVNQFYNRITNQDFRAQAQNQFFEVRFSVGFDESIGIERIVEQTANSGALTATRVLDFTTTDNLSSINGAAFGTFETGLQNFVISPPPPTNLVPLPEIGVPVSDAPDLADEPVGNEAPLDPEEEDFSYPIYLSDAQADILAISWEANGKTYTLELNPAVVGVETRGGVKINAQKMKDFFGKDWDKFHPTKQMPGGDYALKLFQDGAVRDVVRFTIIDGQVEDFVDLTKSDDQSSVGLEWSDDLATVDVDDSDFAAAFVRPLLQTAKDLTAQLFVDDLGPALTIDDVEFTAAPSSRAARIAAVMHE